ncbi:MAG: ABC transporter permease [Planctomycetes bacterium]|nr:ABC transporter permease [Planctomycetota bacterium]MBI3843602.1 ABC transporter permease [Planctomycetota bacterium]
MNVAATPAKRGVRSVVWSTVAPFLGLLLVLAIFWLYGLIWKPDSVFLSGFRMALIAKQTAIVGMGALGMTVIIASGGIDLSVGSVLALTSVTLALSLKEGAGPALALALTVGAGVAAGLVNGILVTGLRLVPFIVTLGTMLVFRGLAEEVSSQNKIPAGAPDWMSTLLDPPAPGSVALVCRGVWIVVVLAVVLATVLRRTVFGTRVFAIGSNESAARLCGLPVAQTKIAVYALGGFFTALAGLFEFNNLNRQGDPTTRVGLELDVIAAVVIGGGSLNGGRGSVLGSLVGATMMTTLRNGCAFAEVGDPVQKIVVGVIIVAAVTIDQLRQRRRSE